MQYRIVALPAKLERANFSSGSEPLDRYFHTQVSQEIRRRITGCFVALSENDGVAGYYTLASATIPLTDLPESYARKLPRYPAIPAVLLGRLAVDKRFQGRGLGGALLYDALLRSVQSDIAAHAMVVDAKDDAAVPFYQHHGFISLPNVKRTLMLPLATFATTNS